MSILINRNAFAGILLLQTRLTQRFFSEMNTLEFFMSIGELFSDRDYIKIFQTRSKAPRDLCDCVDLIAMNGFRRVIKYRTKYQQIFQLKI